MQKSTIKNSPSQTRLALRPREAARALGIGVRLLWSLTNSGQIPSIRIGRCRVYSVAALADWLRDNTQGSQP